MCCTITALMVMTLIACLGWDCNVVDEWHPPQQMVFLGRNEWLKLYVGFIQRPLQMMLCSGIVQAFSAALVILPLAASCFLKWPAVSVVISMPDAVPHIKASRSPVIDHGDGRSSCRLRGRLLFEDALGAQAAERVHPAPAQGGSQPAAVLLRGVGVSSAPWGALGS